MSALLHRGIDLPPVEENTESKETTVELSPEAIQAIQKNKSDFMKRKAGELNG